MGQTDLQTISDRFANGFFMSAKINKIPKTVAPKSPVPKDFADFETLFADFENRSHKNIRRDSLVSENLGGKNLGGMSVGYFTFVA